MVQSFVRNLGLGFVFGAALPWLGVAVPALAQESEPQAVEESIPAGEIEALVAPIALYPDDLLAQTLVASTYPLEIIQLQQWLLKHPDLEGDELEAALEDQPWDPAIKSMAVVPEVVDRLANDIQWTTDLGNAFLAQQDDVLEAAQTMRRKAQDMGALESGEQMIVETQVVERDTIIIVQSATPEVIYVPSYNPVVVYGPPVYYAYPPIYYPPPPPGGLFISFSIGVMWGRHWGGPCCGCGWGRGSTNIYINNSNNFYRNSGRGDGTWKHNPEHRGAAPYGDRKTADKYGGRTPRDTPRAGGETRPATGTRDRGAEAGNRDRSGQREGADRPATNDRSRDSNASQSRDRDRSSGSANRGGSDRVGDRNVQKSDKSRGSNGLGGGSHGNYDRNRAQNSRDRGQASRGGSHGGSRGGGGRKGGRR